MGRSRSDEAIDLAVQGRWEEAISVNQEILETSPNDIDALNRLGKALSEVGRNSESRKAYERVIELDQHNSIARKNLDRLSRLRDKERAKRETHGIDSRFFIEETSKARRVSLHRLASPEVLGKMAPGDSVHLRVSGGRLEIVNDDEVYLGEVEPRIGARLAGLIQGGNQYKAAIISLGREEPRVIIRETYQHPSQAGYPSFPPPKMGEEIRPYLKDSIVKRGIDEEVPDDDESPADEWVDEEESLEEDDGSLEEEFPVEKEDMDRVV